MARRCSSLTGNDWNLTVTETTDGVTLSADRIAVVLLYEIREELKRLNGLLHCQNFTGMPATLRAISRKIPTRKPRKRTP